VRVIQVLPAGASPHTFDLTPGKVRELQEAAIIFKIGIMDDWIDAVAESLPEVAVVTLRKNVPLRPFPGGGHGHGAVDPHYWLSAANGARMARTVAETLAAAYPGRAAVYEKNGRAVAAELTDLHGELQRELSGLRDRRMVVFHDAWRYFAAAYGLEIAAVFQSSPGREPTPRDIRELYALAGKYRLRTIFTEPQLPTAAIEPMMADLGLEAVIIDPLGGSAAGDSYAALLRRNARAIRRALEH
ncbi:MAG: zinc ABC transporter substrate-binding protein, partial [Candidatus Aminicenantes bacterium]|nr:zinc ABC transporter substrate-binding protein [Candidatus Aminicenantes bacterium]